MLGFAPADSDQGQTTAADTTRTQSNNRDFEKSRGSLNSGGAVLVRDRIHIDPSSFAITLYSEAGHALSKERLSEGEKQIFAISVLWGLARASAHPLPAIIDTPMARLDAAHRRHLVERYFPHASHQVLILSTDTEVDRHYYQALQPHIARAYHLDYDEKTRATHGREGYFWEETPQAVDAGSEA